jgi:lipopolysaccharide biosynthesis glycosyltransferase
MKKGTVLVTGGTHSDTAPIAVFLMNMKQTNDGLFDKVIVFHDGISSKDQKLMQQIMDVEFRLYKPPFSSRNGVVVNYFSPMLFCKYECLHLLDEYHQVVWSDYDVVIQKPLDEICTLPEGVYLAATSSDTVTVKSRFYEHKIDAGIQKYDLNAQGLCAALMVFSDEMPNYNEMCDWCYHMTEEFDTALFCAEEAILSVMLQEYHLKFEVLNTAIYAVHPNNMLGGESILHSSGEPKFWNGLYNEVWDANYAEWLRMGGGHYHDGWKCFRRKCRLIRSKLTGIKDSANEKNGR